MELINKHWIVIAVIYGVCIFIKPDLCFLIFGILASYVGFDSIKLLNKITNTGIECTGNILEFQSNNHGHKIPIIEFTTMTGDIVKEKPFIYTSTDLSIIMNCKNFINQPVAILYDPDDPKKFIIKDDEGPMYTFNIIFILSGILIVGLSISWLLG